MVAGRKTNRTTRKKATASKGAAGRKKVAGRKKAARKPAAKKATAGKTVARKTTKPVRKAVRRTTKPRAPAKNAARKTVRKTTRSSPARTAAIAAVPEPPAEFTPLTPGVKRRTNLRKKDLDQFRELLLVKRAQLVGDVSTLQKQALSENRQEAAGDLSSMPIHMADLGTDNYEKEFTLGLIESERTLLREIDEALGRIEQGIYGICEATGKPIGKARLKAQPWVKYCYEYVLAQESGRQSSGL